VTAMICLDKWEVIVLISSNFLNSRFQGQFLEVISRQFPVDSEW